MSDLDTLINDLDAALAEQPNVNDQWWQDCGTIKRKLLSLRQQAQPTREEALEEAAKVAEARHAEETDDDPWCSGWRVACNNIAAAIRALKSIDAPAREGGGETKLIDDIINGTAPMSKWMGSVDYSTYDGFEEYLKTQLREKMDLKVRLDKKRHESAEDESLATFVDGGSGALEAALATYRTVRERVAAASPSPSVSEPVAGWALLNSTIDKFIGNDGVFEITKDTAEAAHKYAALLEAAGCEPPRMFTHGGDAIVFTWDCPDAKHYLTISDDGQSATLRPPPVPVGNLTKPKPHDEALAPASDAVKPGDETTNTKGNAR